MSRFPIKHLESMMKISLNRLLLTASVLMLTQPAGAQTLPDLDGSWAEQRVYTVLTKAPFVGKVTTRKRFLALYRFVQKGAVIDVTGTICALKFDSSFKRIRTRVAQGFLDALNPLKGKPKLAFDKASKVWRLSTSKQIRVLGARLKRPGKDALPTDPSDPRVVDMDKDGKPGVTVTVDGLASGDLYFVQRMRWSSDATVVSNDVINGTLSWTREQHFLGASSLMLRGRKGKAKGGPHPDPKLHTVQLRRVPATLKCSDLIKKAPELFASP